MRALIRKWGDSAPGPPVGVVLLPAPGKLAAAAYYDLHPLGLERKRAETLLRAACWHGRIQQTADLSSAEASRFLQRLPGIGKWTAATTVAVSHGDADAVAVGDYHLKSVVAWQLEGRPPGTDERDDGTSGAVSAPSRQGGENFGEGGSGAAVRTAHATARLSVSAS